MKLNYYIKQWKKGQEIMDDQIICHQCGGNGYVKVRFEAEQAIEQCKVCDSQGELIQDKHYCQTWSDGISNETTSFYYGPPLDPEGFKNYQIHSG